MTADERNAATRRRLTGREQWRRLRRVAFMASGVVVFTTVALIVLPWLQGSLVSDNGHLRLEELQELGSVRWFVAIAFVLCVGIGCLEWFTFDPEQENRRALAYNGRNRSFARNP